MKKILLITTLLVLSSTVAFAYNLNPPIISTSCIGGYLFAVAYTPNGDSSDLQLVQILKPGSPSGALAPVECN